MEQFTDYWKGGNWPLHRILFTGFLFGFLGLSFGCFTYAQSGPDFGFEMDPAVPVQRISGSPLKWPWTGGMNAIQLGEVDLDRDGQKDLLAFDRHGNRWLPFRRQTDPDAWQFDPSLAIGLPAVTDWMILRDYDGDGRNDLFTSTVGGIKIYRNISASRLRFQLVTPLLKSLYYSSYVNILVTTADYPGIVDLDQDGDLDILTFFGLGSFIEYHRNMSMEKYGHADSLDFALQERCWGYFMESEESNVISLHVDCPFDEANGIDRIGESLPRPDRHTGSTFLVRDLNNDGLQDLLLGDVDFPQLIHLTNGGTTDSAHMISQDADFPQGTDPIRLVSFPVAHMMDFDFDGVDDLLVSTFSPAFDQAVNDSSVWLYHNQGTNELPDLELQQKNFLQDEMIEMGAGAYPLLVDLDADGLQDLVVGNYGRLDSSWFSLGFLKTRYHAQLAIYRNTGSVTQPAFKLVDQDVAGLSKHHLLNLVPTAGDLDRDGDQDLLLGCIDGQLIYLKNIAPSGQWPEFEWDQQAFQGLDAGAFAAPQLVDLDQDGSLDLVVGKKDGTLSYYQQAGTANEPAFELVTAFLGEVDVTDPNLSLDGYSQPCFFVMNDTMRLFVGSEFGKIFYYKNIEGHLSDVFELADSHLAGLGVGWRSAVAVQSMDGDAYPDLVVGNFAGGLNYYKGAIPSSFGINEPVDLLSGLMKIGPVPANGQLHLELPASWTVKSVQLMDVMGRRVPLQETARFQFSWTSLPPACYLLRVKAEYQGREYRASRKVLIAR